MGWVQLQDGDINRRGTGGPSRVYWERDRREAGSLLLWLSRDGRVTDFQLSYTSFPAGKELFLEWRAGRRFRVGEIDSGEPSDRAGPRFKMSPVVKSSSFSEGGIIERLRVYFDRRADALEIEHAAQIRSVLAEPPREPPG